MNTRRTLNVPPRLLELAQGHPGARELVAALTSDMVTETLHGDYYFEYYTDHGIDHVETVLDYASKLIPSDDVWRKLGPFDAAVLVGSVVMHDIAMHIPRDGFCGESVLWSFPKGGVPQQVNQEWLTLWDDYLIEVAKWDDAQRAAIVGDGTEDPRRFEIGEFIRRHHGILAQQVVLYGLPGADTFPRISAIAPRLAKAIGLVARSHVVSFDCAVKELESSYQIRAHEKQQGAYLAYHMALLRVADLLHIGVDRAPPDRRALLKPTSPVSTLEWEKDASVWYVDGWESGHEINVLLEGDLQPEPYFLLKSYLAELRREMRDTNAVLAERLRSSELSLTKTDVVSNIDDPGFPSDLSFYPEKAVVRANPGVLDLLVRPLYGNRSEVGVRELLQNALDAVREGRLFCQKHGIAARQLKFAHVDCDVLVELREQSANTWTLRVSDRGVGMKAETVLKYFVVAGASYRRDKDWRHEFTTEEQSAVLRSGRFGVGVFAAFLLGDTLRVQTRHLSRDSVGYAFEI